MRTLFFAVLFTSSLSLPSPLLPTCDPEPTFTAANGKDGGKKKKDEEKEEDCAQRARVTKAAIS
jgi:hypothetical protein